MASTTSDTDDTSSKQQHVCMCECVCVCVCHNEKKMPDKWQARQITAVILQVRSSKHKAKKSAARVCVCVRVCGRTRVCMREECVSVERERERERERDQTVHVRGLPRTVCSVTASVTAIIGVALQLFDGHIPVHECRVGERLRDMTVNTSKFQQRKHPCSLLDPTYFVFVGTGRRSKNLFAKKSSSSSSLLMSSTSESSSSDISSEESGRDGHPG